MSLVQHFQALNRAVQQTLPHSALARQRVTFELTRSARVAGESAAEAVRGLSQHVRALDAALLALESVWLDSTESSDFRLQQAALALLDAALIKAVTEGALRVRAPNPLQTKR
jgi:hypothetical protein